MLISLTKKNSQSSFIKNVSLIAGGTAAGQGIIILSTPVVTRLYTPADFGVFTVFVALLGIIGQLSTLRYSVTIPLADKEEFADNVLRLCFLISLFLSLVLGLAVFLLGDFFAARFSVPHAAPYLWLLPVCLFGTGVYEALSNWAIRRKDFNVIARTKLSQGVSSSGIKIGLGWFGIRPLGLLLGLLAAQVAGSGSLFLKLIKEKPSFFRSISWEGIGFAAKRFSRFPLLQSWSRLLLSLGVQLPAIFMAAFYGAEVVGLFGLAHSMVNLPMNLLGTSVSQVYYAEIAKYGKSKPDKILKLSVSIIKKMLFVGTIPMTVIMVAGPLLFSFVFGAEWHDAGVYARLLAIIILTRFVASPVAHCFDVLEMQGTQLFLNIVRVVLIVIIFMICKYIDLSSYTAVNIYSIFLALYYVFMIAVVFVSFGRFKKAAN